MKFLILDTSQPNCNIILDVNGSTQALTLGLNEKPSENLLVALESLLVKAKVSLNEIDVFGCVTGPGSFTGIRIAITTIKAFLQVFNNAKLVYANVFEILAETVRDGFILVPSTNTTCYYGLVENGKVVKYDTLIYEEINSVIDSNIKVVSLGCEQMLNKVSYTKYETINNYEEIIYKYFANKIGNNNFNDKKYLEPFYIQVSQAEKDLNKGV